jgi:RIO kinase 1
VCGVARRSRLQRVSTRDELSDLWHRLEDAPLGPARHGLTHGGLSAYNLLVPEGGLVLIDLPQVVDVIVDPQGPAVLARDIRRVGDWFRARGLETGLPDALLGGIRVAAGMAGTAGTSHPYARRAVDRQVARLD